MKKLEILAYGQEFVVKNNEDGSYTIKLLGDKLYNIQNDEERDRVDKETMRKNREFILSDRQENIFIKISPTNIKPEEISIWGENFRNVQMVYLNSPYEKKGNNND